MPGFTFKFEDKSKDVPEFSTKDQMWLREITMKIRGINKFNENKLGENLTEDMIQAGEREIVRLEDIYKDVMKRLTKEEKVEYKTIMKARQPKAFTKEEQAAITKQMESNRDRPSH